MKLKHQLAAFAAFALLAGCSENDEMGTQKQSAVPAVTNEAKPADTAAVPAPRPDPSLPPTPAPTPPVAYVPPPPATPVPPPPPADSQAGTVTPPPAAADPAATNATAATNSDAGDKK
ncbi:MAG TPA: hypothetical protein VNZ64_21435 [Candidatus Acidoferrum sp.]|nr:hypothetical protein [Candidatus Acidoferrum sp.]